MLKIGNLWLNIEKVNMAHLDESGRLSIYFNQDAWLKVNGNEQPDKIKQLVACLDAAAGYTPAAKVEAEEGETLYGVAPDGRKIRETLRHMPDLNEPHPLRRVDRLRYLTPKGIIKALHLTRICPPNKACEFIPHGDEPSPDCEQCWISWLWERDDLPDGDPDA